MVEYDVPAMIHVSTSCNPCFHTTGAHYLNADTTAFMQCLTADLFRDFPTLRFVIPHGGGAVPYHWGRFRGLAQELGKPLLRVTDMFEIEVVHRNIRRADGDVAKQLGAVAAGAPMPSITTEDALREAVLGARSIGCSTGPSGVHLARLLERWGIADIVAPRVVQAPPGVPVGTLVARGDVELGFQQHSELLHVAGIDVVGMLPAAVDVITVFAAAACTTAVNHAAVDAVLAFFASPAADAVKRRHGMMPAREDA